MKFLFFDIECSNCFDGQGKICEYGYVLTDENFNILVADDIPISPGFGEENGFFPESKGENKIFEFAYEQDFYLSCPEFPTYYEFIKGLMEDADTVCFAFSMQNDIRYLDYTCKRYGLKPLNYVCYDIQMLVSRILNSAKLINLEKACSLFVGSNYKTNITAHLSRDDAKMTMMILREIIKRRKADPIFFLRTINFCKTSSLILIEKTEEKFRTKKIRQDTRSYYNSICKSDFELSKAKYKGKRVCLSSDVFKRTDIFAEMIDLFLKNGFVFSRHIFNADIFVIVAKSSELSEISNKIKNKFSGVLLTPKDIKLFIKS